MLLYSSAACMLVLWHTGKEAVRVMVIVEFVLDGTFSTLEYDF